MSTELERTRADVRWMVGRRDDVTEVIRQGQVRAVGQFRGAPAGRVAVPVIYVSKRATPFYVRHRWPLVAVGSFLLLTSIVATGVMWIGPAPFLAALLLAVFVVLSLARWSRGGGRSVSVTTTTTVRVK